MLLTYRFATCKHPVEFGETWFGWQQLILVVEDEPTIRMTAAAIVEMHEYKTTTTAADGEEGPVAQSFLPYQQLSV